MGTTGISRLVEPNASYTFVVSEVAAGARLDKFLAEQFSSYSRNFFQQLIDKGRVLVNDVPCAKTGTVVKVSDSVHVTFPPARQVVIDEQLDEDIGVEVLHEEQEFLVVYKPAGLLVHTPHHLSTEVTLVDWLLRHYREIDDVGYVDRPGIVHRLDKDTSGLLIVPRTCRAHATFTDMFRERRIHKMYYAIVTGHPDERGLIDLPIGRDPHYRSRMKAFKPTERPAGKLRDAVTHFKVDRYFQGCSLVEVRPVTGRTHQIRVHFAARGHSLIGDVLYGTQSKQLGRHALHACELVFSFGGKEYRFTRTMPEDFKKFLSYSKPL